MHTIALMRHQGLVCLLTLALDYQLPVALFNEGPLTAETRVLPNSLSHDMLIKI